MAFLKHEQCPRCAELGQDRRGNNLARYTNGSAFCFSCHHIERADGFRPDVSRESRALPTDLISSLPPENRAWLGQYLSDEEVSTHFRYSPSLKRHVFTSGKFWEARSVIGGQPKAIQHGDKPYVLIGSGEIGGVVVFCEDAISAIKVGRVATAVPLFGNALPPDWMVRTLKLIRPNRVFIWLDSDMDQQSRRLAKKMNLLAPGLVRTIETELDPKAYSTEKIQEFIQ